MNFDGRFSGELGWETVQQITSDEDHDCFGKFSNQFDSEDSPIFLSNFGSEFSRTKSLCFENWIFLLTFGLGICEGVGEDSGYGIGHVDIRVSSCYCLNMFVCHACALRWGVTQVGNFLYWALLTLSRDHHFRYRERPRRRHSLEAL